jgi:hypothetical protein
VLHRLPEAKVGAERDRGNQFGEADSRGSGSAHGPSLDNGSGKLLTLLCTATRAAPVLSASRAPQRQSSLGVGSSVERGQPITHLKRRSSPATPAAVGHMRGSAYETTGR